MNRKRELQPEGTGLDDGRGQIQQYLMCAPNFDHSMEVVEREQSFEVFGVFNKSNINNQFIVQMKVDTARVVTGAINREDGIKTYRSLVPK